MMERLNEDVRTPRYGNVTPKKAEGATYTPKILSDFVARQIVAAFRNFPVNRPLRVLDPAIGDGELLISLLEELRDRSGSGIEVYGFEPDEKSLGIAARRLKERFPAVPRHFEPQNFLEFVLNHFGTAGQRPLFGGNVPEAYDLIIVNPPYVRTQIMGGGKARLLAEQFGLSGRVDLYYAFILAMAEVLKPKGVAGIIVSNRFMTTRSGASVRRALLGKFNLRYVWDLGDTKLFDAAVLPSVLVAEGKNGQKDSLPGFTSIYETAQPAAAKALTPIEALSREGVVQIEDKRRFLVQHGKLDTGDRAEGVWRVATESADAWLATVNAHTWRRFADVGRIRVGVKTCADDVFIRSDWDKLPEDERPELLRPIMTHHLARRFKAIARQERRQILYPHEVVLGRRRAVDLSLYPRSEAYLQRYRAALEGRKYVTEAGREWYEIWVPQDPAAWGQTKLVFRDIAEEPTFWVDEDGSVVNGDCYWMVCKDREQRDLLWLAAAVGNSHFIKRFYDSCFHNKLYAGRRRFMTQYVERFPLPDAHTGIGKAIIAKAKQIYADLPSVQAQTLQAELDHMVWEAFGLRVEEVTG